MTATLRVESSLPAVLVLAVLGHQPIAHGQTAATVELVSVGTDGIAGNSHSGSDGINPPRTRITADGRYVAFESFASTIVCSDNDSSTQDVFVRDRRTGRAVVASVPWNGGEANHNSFDPVISADGRYVAFASQATNLVPGDTNGFIDVFLRDLQAGTTTRLSVSSTGEQSNSVSYGAAISGDGRFVAFYSGGSNLVAGDNNNRFDTFVRDVVAGTTERVSVSSAGVENWCCDGLYPSISSDGRYVAFLAQGSLDPSVPPHWQQIYIRDRVAGTTTLVRPTATGELSNTGIRFADISANGRFVAFQSNSDNIVTPDQNGFAHDVFVKDLVTGATTLVSQSTDGTQGNHDSWMPSISADGRYVAFHSWANNLVPGDTNTQPYYDVFLRDTLLGTTTRVNLTPGGGEADGSSIAPSISADGTLVLFDTTATNLVPNELINGAQDVYLAGPPFPGAAWKSFEFEALAPRAGEASGTATMIVARAGPLCTTATVQYATANGTATAGEDYTPASGTLTFLAGEASKTFDVAVLDDARDEPDETVLLHLSHPTGGLVLGSPSTATLTIADDDVSASAPPDALDDVATTAEDTSVGIAVLANDSDPSGDPLTITEFTQGASGTVADNGDGTLTYTPSARFQRRRYVRVHRRRRERGGTDTASVAVTVTPVNDAPTAAADRYAARPGTVLTIGSAAGVLANDADPDGEALVAVVVDGPTSGTLTLAPDGSFTYTPPAAFPAPRRSPTAPGIRSRRAATRRR